MTFQKGFCVLVHLKYIVLFGLAFKSDFGASCTVATVYRKFFDNDWHYTAAVFFLLFIVNAIVFLFIMLFKMLGHLKINKTPVQGESDTEQILNQVELLTDEEKSFNK